MRVPVLSLAVLAGLLGVVTASWSQPAGGNRIRLESAQKAASSPVASTAAKANLSVHSKAIAASTPQDRHERAAQVSSKVLKKTGESASAAASNLK